MFIKCNKNFSWSYSNMSSLDPSLFIHSLPFKKDVKSIKQKIIKMHPSKAILVKNEIEKYLNVGFIRQIDYFEWMSNINCSYQKT